MMNAIRFLPGANVLRHTLGHFVARHQALQLVYCLHEIGLCGMNKSTCLQQA
jgi:hypothetical protein